MTLRWRIPLNKPWWNRQYHHPSQLAHWKFDDLYGDLLLFYRQKHKFSVTNVGGVIRFLSNNINPKFLYYQLDLLHKTISFDYVTKAHPSVIAGLYKIRIPNKIEQDKIALLLDVLDKKITLESDKLELIKALKAGYMQQMFI